MENIALGFMLHALKEQFNENLLSVIKLPKTSHELEVAVFVKEGTKYSSREIELLCNCEDYRLPYINVTVMQGDIDSQEESCFIHAVKNGEELL